MLTDFHFIRPLWLLALVPYLVILVLMLRSKLSQGNWSAVCDPALLPYLLQEQALKPSRATLTTTAIAAFLTITALAGPSWQRLPTPVFRNQAALVIALDLSNSMDAQDIKPSRLIRARYKIADILQQRKDGLTALLVYAGDAFTVTPLTNDTATIDSQLTALTTKLMEDIVPSTFGNTERALAKAVELLDNAGVQQGQIILITDSASDNANSYAAQHASDYRLSVLGVGTADGAPIASPDGGFVKDERGNIVVPQLNTDDLTQLAQAGGGHYQSLSADDSDIKALLADVAQPTAAGAEQHNQLLEQWDDNGPWLLLLVLPLAALNFRKGLLGLALFILLPLPKNSYALDWQDLWQSQDQQAQQAYQQQHFQQAAEQFDNPEWKAAAYYKAGDYAKALAQLDSKQSAATAYNRGNALAKSGKLADALKAYDQALAVNPNDADAKYNKALVEQELQKQQQKQDQDQDQKDDKQGQNGNPSQPKNNEQGKASEQAANNQKPEQKPERKPSDAKEAAKTAQQKQAEAEAAKKQAEAAQQADKTAKDKQKDKPSTPAMAQPINETQQANEQWLNRIPDDPAGLLKRKFKYQYGQRNQQ